MRRYLWFCTVMLNVPLWLLAQSIPQQSPSLGKMAQGLPIFFEPNVGQNDSRYRYVAHQGNFGLALAAQEADVSLRGRDGNESVIQVLFMRANPKTELIAEQRMSGTANYLVGADPKQWKTHVPLFSRVLYRQVYSGIDLSFYGRSRTLEYDFIVAPGADPRQVAMRVQGARPIHVSKNGDLVLETTNGRMSFKRPLAYQEIKGQRREVEARFRVRHSTIQFDLGNYDRSRELVIDPVLSYSTYVAGDSGSQVAAIAVDADGSAYITGLTFSTFPTKSAFQSTCNNCSNNPDLFVTKLSQDGSSLVYSTYLGGSNYDQPYGIAVDGQKSATVVGRTNSTDFPTLPVTTISGQNSRGFVASLAPTGDALNWSQYIGGSSGDSADAVTVDSSGNVFVAGDTWSSDFPVTFGTIPHATPAYPTTDTFVAKFSSTGTVQYSAILGHTNTNDGYSFGLVPHGIGVDGTGNAIIAGSTSNNLITTPGAFQTTPGNASPSSGSTFNGFITKINSDASALIYSTYFGGTQGAPISALAVDANGAAYITGTSPTVPATSGAFQTQVPVNGVPGFVAKFDSSGSLVYCTYLGAPTSSYMELNGIAADSAGNAYLAGFTTSNAFPLVNPVQSTGQGGAIAVELNSSGSALLFSTYLSGTPASIGFSASRASSIAVDNAGNILLTGTAYSTDFPTTPGAYQTAVTPPPAFVTPQYPFVTKIDVSVASPSVCFGSNGISFGTVQVGSSLAKNLVVTNCGNAPLTVSGVSVSGPASSLFTTTNNCSTAVTPSGTCTVGVTFSPIATGNFTANLVLSDNAPITPQTVALAGTGAVPTVTVPTQFLFPNVVLGESGVVQRVFITNSGRFPVHITGVSVNGDFSAVNQCPGTLNPFASCGADVTFIPSAIGLRTGSLTFQDDASGGPHSVPLSGDALATYPTPIIANVNPSSLEVGTTGALYIYGSNFFPSSIIWVNGVDYPTTYSSSGTSLQTTLTTTDVAQISELAITVTNPSPGGESNKITLPIYKVVDLNARWLSFDPYSRQLFASVGNAVVPIDPTTGTTGTPITVGNTANRIDISTDSRYLYVGLDGDHAVERVDLDSNTPDQQMALGSDWLTGNTRRAGEIRIKPDDNRVVAVVTYRPASPSESSLNLYTNGVLVGSLTNEFPTYYAVNSVAFDPVDGSKLYGFIGGPKGFGTLNVTSSALTINSEVALAQNVSLGFPPIAALPGQVYTTSGDVINPVDGTRLFRNDILGVANSVLLYPDLGLVYYLDQSGNLLAFDSNHQSLGSVGSFGYEPYSLARWSHNGFAAIKDGVSDVRKVVLFQASIGQPSTSAGVAAPMSAAPSSLRKGSGNTTLTLSGTNFVPGAFVLWNGAERTTTFIDDGHVQVKIGRGDLAHAGTANIAVVNPGTSPSPNLAFPIFDRAGSVSTDALSFGNTAIGASVTLPVSLTNVGSSAMAISQIVASAPFSQHGDCGSQLAAGATCTIQVTFTPVTAGPFSGSLSVTEDQDSISATVTLSGTGVVPMITFSSNDLSFGTVSVGQSGSPMSVTLTNSGSVPVSLGNFSVTGDFTSTNTCGTSMAAGASCQLTAVFKPTAAGPRQGAVTIADDASGNPHRITLQGIGSDLQLGAAPGSSMSAIVAAGQVANYSLSVTGSGGFSGTVIFACSGVPQFASCSVSPTSASLSANGSTTVSVSVTTSQTVAGLSQASSNLFLASVGWFPLVIVVPTMLIRRKLTLRRRAVALMLLLVISVMLSSLVACGGGGSAQPTPQQPQIQKVAPGTYTLTVTATSAAVVRQSSLTLVVQ